MSDKATLAMDREHSFRSSLGRHRALLLELASADSASSLASVRGEVEEDAVFTNEWWRRNGSHHVGFMGEGLCGQDDETLGSSV